MDSLITSKMLLKILVTCVCAHFVAGQGSIPGIKDSCFLNPESGNCKAYLPSFYYNKAAKYCDCFVYTGCSGNENRYDTLDDCRYACNVVSNQQIISNTCRNILRGTPMLAELLNRTEYQGIIKPDGVSNTIPVKVVDVDCSLPPEMGPCRAYLPSYYYDPINKYCDCFVFSGCGGNENRFRTLNDCRLSCDVGADKQVVTKTCKTILHGTSQWTEFLEQLSGPPVQDSTIDKIDIRKQPFPSVDSSKDSSVSIPTKISDKDPSIQSSNPGIRNEPPSRSSSSDSDRGSFSRPSSSDSDRGSFSKPSSSDSDRGSSSRPSNSGSINTQFRPSPDFNPGPIKPDVLIPPPRVPQALPPRPVVMAVFHRVKEIRESHESRGDRD